MRNTRKRKITAPIRDFSSSGLSIEESNQAIETRLKEMAKDSTWGEAIEISAFTKAYNMDVRIFATEYSHYIRAVEDEGAVQRPIAYIAYHVNPIEMKA